MNEYVSTENSNSSCLPLIPRISLHTNDHGAVSRQTSEAKVTLNIAMTIINGAQNTYPWVLNVADSNERTSACSENVGILGNVIIRINE